MLIVKNLRLIIDNNKIRNILEKLRKFWIFNVNVNEFIKIFDVSFTLLL